MARSKKPVRSKSRRPKTAKRRAGIAPRKRAPVPDSDPLPDFAKPDDRVPVAPRKRVPIPEKDPLPDFTRPGDSLPVVPRKRTPIPEKDPAPDLARPGDRVPVAPLSRFTLADAARKVLSRSDWNKSRQDQLSDECSALAAKLKKSCPHIRVDNPLKAGEVPGDIAIRTKDFHAIMAFAAGAKENPQVVWSDGTNELLVIIADMAVKTTDGLILVKIPVSCEETGRKTILVTFATGSPENPAGLLFATDTVPEGPPEIVEIWGEALTALAWTSVLRAVSALADVAGTDQDGAGLVPVGLATDRSGVKLLVMARHEMDRVSR